MSFKSWARKCTVLALIVTAWVAPAAIAQTGTQRDEAATAAEAAAAKAKAAFAAVAEGSEPAGQNQAPTRRRRPPAAYSKTGYIDSAIIGNYGRVRLDIARDNVTADRGEFFYAKCGCYREVGLDPFAPGPAPQLMGADPTMTQFIETNVDFTDIWFTGEYQFHERFSGIVDGVIRTISPEVNDNATGIGDLIVGVKAAILAEESQFVTFQLKATLPTGNALEGLGTANTWWEPGLLYWRQLNDRTDVAAEFRISVPVGGSSDAGVPELTGGTLGGGDFSSTVIRYGIGGSYEVNPDSSVVVAPVVEMVAWTVNGGYATTTEDGTAATAGADRADTTIVNLKIGARLSLADYPESSVYLGWGTALTANAWYENIFRFEYRYAFF